MKKAPIKITDIAALAQVSVGTIDRVLHNRNDVSEKTRNKVLKIIDELGYKTNIIAKTLASKKQIVFSTLIPEVDQLRSYWEKPLQGIKKAEKEFNTYGVSTENYFFSLHNKDTFIEQAEAILKQPTQGVIIAPVFQKEALDFVEKLNEKNIPYVFLDSQLEHDEQSRGYVGHDSFQSGKVAAKLIDDRITGLDNILLINLSINPANENHLNQRTNGFKNYFRAKKRMGTIIEVDIANLDSQFVSDKLEHVFGNVSNIRAVFVTNSKVHMVAKFLEDSSLKNNLVIVGYDLIDANRMYLKKGTIDYLISQNPEEQGYRSVDKIFRSVILQQETNRKIFLPIHIVIKENEMYC